MWEENKIAKKLTFQRFMSNTFDSQHTPTVTNCDFYPSLVYECSIVEVIMVKMFYRDSKLQQNYEKTYSQKKIVDIFRILFSLVSSCGFASDRKLSNNKWWWVEQVKSFQNYENICITKNRKSQCLLCKMKHISVSRYPNYGLRNADAYLLVYDVTSASSFNYIQLMR